MTNLDLVPGITTENAHGERPGGSALAGVRVLDLAGEQGFFCGRILGDLGADVIKIEPPGGDPARRKGPFVDGIPHLERSLYWWAFNTNKRGITLNLETVDGRDLFRSLVRTADVVVESYQPAYLSSIGLGYDEIRDVRSDVIMTSISPYGASGPHSHRPAVDINLQGAGTHLYLNGDPDRPPVRVGAPAAYLHGGAEGAAATNLALYHRLRTGVGQWIDVSTQEAVITTLVNSTMTWQLTGREEVRGGAIRQERAGHLWVRQVWECADGLVCYTPIGGGGGIARAQAYERLLEWMAQSGEVAACLIEGPWNRSRSDVDWATVTQEMYDEAADVIAAFLRTKSLEELWQKSLTEGFLIAPVRTMREILDAPHFALRKYFVDVDHPELGRSQRYAGPFAHLSGTPVGIHRRAPLIGEHNQQIYGDELGLDSGELALLFATNVI